MAPILGDGLPVLVNITSIVANVISVVLHVVQGLLTISRDVPLAQAGQSALRLAAGLTMV
ncbi:MAG: hypothetical protein ACREHD_01680 [Pirellulales bacterium]